MIQQDNQLTEQAVISILLGLAPEESKEHIATLKIEYFTSNITKKAFSVIHQIYVNGSTIDAINFRRAAISSKLLSKDDLTEIIRWNRNLQPGRPIGEYIEAIIDTYIQTEIENIATTEISKSGNIGHGSLMANNIIKKISGLLDSTSTGISNLISMQQLMQMEREGYYMRKELADSGRLSGQDTGLDALNRFTGGWQKELIVIAARPGMGKTAFALFTAVKSNTSGIYVNMEMNVSQLAQRLILQHAEISSKGLRDGKLNHSEILQMEGAINTVSQLPFSVWDEAGVGVHKLMSKIRRFNRAGLCNWVIIDYLQLMTLEGPKNTNREQEVSNIVKIIKNTQKELGIPFILLAQLSREPEKRGDKKPILADLRESGEIEQSADTVGFIFRPGYYGLNLEDGTPATNEISILFKKHRQGPIGEVDFKHSPTLATFYNFEVPYSGVNTKMQSNDDWL